MNSCQHNSRTVNQSWTVVEQLTNPEHSALDPFQFDADADPGHEYFFKIYWFFLNEQLANIFVFFRLFLC